MTHWARETSGTSFAVRSLANGLRNSVRLELLQQGVERETRNLCERQCRAVANYLQRFVEHSPAEAYFTCTVKGSVNQGAQHITVHISSEPDRYAIKQPEQGAAA